jgi:hypothetical protein
MTLPSCSRPLTCPAVTVAGMPYPASGEAKRSRLERARWARQERASRYLSERGKMQRLPPNNWARVRGGFSNPTSDFCSTAGSSSPLRLSYVAIEKADGSIATSGKPPGSSRTWPLSYDGKSVGTLVLGPPRGERRLSRADQRVIDLVAAPTAIVLHAQLLTRGS